MAGALPYIELPSLPLFTLPRFGEVAIQPFGVLFALGIVLGAKVARKHAERTGADLDVLYGLTTWVVVGGILMMHWFDVVTYQPEKLLEDPLILLKLWAGISSVGGMLGGYLGFWLFFRKPEHRHLPKLRYLDTAAFGAVVGYIFGRAGCAVVHDHPGRASDAFLAVDFPARSGFPAGPRHDLGLYEFLGLVVIFAIIVWVSKKDRKSGTFMALAALLYAPMRFGLDFLRIENVEHADPRYFGLTPAHYMSVAIFAVGVWLMWYVRSRDTGITPTWLGAEARARGEAACAEEAERLRARDEATAANGGKGGRSGKSASTRGKGSAGRGA
jgi:phosphatidylglycerol:prolipoprotein diacylglycerol transferase